MSAMRKAHPHDCIAGFEHREKYALIRLWTGMRLHVCRLRAIERANALYRKSLNHIDELAAPIIPFAGIAFRVFIRALRTLRRHHCRTGVIFRSNQLNMRFLPPFLLLNRAPYFMIGLRDGGWVFVKHKASFFR